MYQQISKIMVLIKNLVLWAKMWAILTSLQNFKLFVISRDYSNTQSQLSTPLFLMIF